MIRVCVRRFMDDNWDWRIRNLQRPKSKQSHRHLRRRLSRGGGLGRLGRRRPEKNNSDIPHKERDRSLIFHAIIK